MTVADAVVGAPARLGDVRLVAVDGPSGAGKSTLAHGLVAELRARHVATELVPTDHFATWDDPVSWWPRLRDGVLTPLSRGEAGRYRRVEWTGGTPHPGPWIDVGVPDVLVVEGVSAGRTSAGDALSQLCWVDGPDQVTRLNRAVARDGDAARPHLGRWQAFEHGWFAVDRTRERATVHVEQEYRFPRR
jgi:hypothetical protein